MTSDGNRFAGQVLIGCLGSPESAGFETQGYGGADDATHHEGHDDRFNQHVSHVEILLNIMFMGKILDRTALLYLAA